MTWVKSEEFTRAAADCAMFCARWALLSMDAFRKKIKLIIPIERVQNITAMMMAKDSFRAIDLDMISPSINLIKLKYLYISTQKLDS